MESENNEITLNMTDIKVNPSTRPLRVEWTREMADDIMEIEFHSWEVILAMEFLIWDV